MLASFDIKFAKLSFKTAMLNRSTESQDLTNILWALPGKLNIKNVSPSVHCMCPENAKPSGNHEKL